MNMTLFVERMRRWGLKGGLGILDQGLYSGANFLLGILLARWFSPEAYGAFSAAYSIFLLFSVAQVALIAEPMSIFGADQHRHNVASYLNYLLRLQWIASILGSCLIFLFAVLISNDLLRDALMGMAIALPLIFYHWYLRRASYVELQSGLAMLSSFIYSTVLLPIVFLVQTVGRLTSFSAYLAMSLSSVVAGMIVLKRLGLHLLGSGGSETGLDPKKINQELFGFGRWIFPAYLAGWFTTLSFPFLITVLLNAQSAGAFRAVQNLFLPFQQLLAAITLLILPWLARQKSDHGSHRLFSATQLAAGMTGLVAVLYCSLVVIFRREIMAFLYASEFYSSFDALVIFLAGSTLLGSAPLILGLALRVIGQPNIILWSKGAAAIFAFIMGVPMIWMAKMNGVILSVMGSSILEVLLLMFFYLRVKRDAILLSSANPSVRALE
jgi:O-antigen/teichoic acid export membrane protein